LAPAPTTPDSVVAIVISMSALWDVAGKSLGGRRRRRCAASDQYPTVSSDAVGEWVAEPGRQVVARRYRLRSLLGRGGMGWVWLADDEVLHRPVALKQVLLIDPGSAATHTAAWTLALKEARAAARVDHVGVVKIYDVVEEDRCPWIVMELLSGRTLGEAVTAAGPLPVHRVTRVGLCLLDVLQATHHAGMVHRDVKPGNVYLCDGGRVVLTDFGIASSIGDADPATGPFRGSPPYLAPELLDGGHAGPASDLYSLGATLFAGVEGRPPFDGDSLLATLAAMASDAPAPFLRAGPLRAVIEGLLATDPGRRMNAGQARAALRAIR